MTVVIGGSKDPTGTLAPTAPVAPPRPVRLPVRPPPDDTGGGPWHVALVRPEDRDALDELFASCSPETVRLRFFGARRAFPPDYLDAVLAGRPDVHDAVVAYRQGAYGSAAGGTGAYGSGAGGTGGQRSGRVRLAGLASLATAGGSDPLTAELGVLVTDAWQREGVGTAMVAALLARARARGVVRVAASVLPGRAALLGAMARRLGLETETATETETAAGRPTYEWTHDSLTAVYNLTAVYKLNPPVPHTPCGWGGRR